MRVLILSSSMGAGHDGAGKELIRRLEAEGHEARMHDYLDALPFNVGHLVRWNYHLQLRYAPWSYENSYRMMPRIYGLLVWLNRVFAGPKLRRWMRRFPPDVVVSNNPLATLAIGSLRQRGKLDVPAVTYITDFGVHPLWIHQGIDLHLAVHPQAAAAAAEQSGGGDARAPGPLVGDRFRSLLPDRRVARRSLGLCPGQRAVLVVAGSWGVGEIEGTARLLLGSGRYTPVTVCGRDRKLRRRMEREGLGIVIGWTDQMPTLMAAADALVENAGGLTSMEAFAAGLPVVTFSPIPGHGRDNAAAMAAAGVTLWPDGETELLAALDEVTVAGLTRDKMVGTASAMFIGDAAAEVMSVADPVAEPVSLATMRRRRIARRAAAAAAATVAVYGSLTAGVAVAADYGLTVPSDAHPHRQITLAGVTRPVSYLGVRLNDAELADPRVRAELTSLSPTVIVTGRTATANATAVKDLVSGGVNLATGGSGRAHTQVLPEHKDVASERAISAATGVRPAAYIPARPVDALDLLWASSRHLSIVVPNHSVVPDRLPARLDAGQSYVLDGRLATPDQLLGALSQLHQTAETGGTVLVGLQAFE